MSRGHHQCRHITFTHNNHLLVLKVELEPYQDAPSPSLPTTKIFYLLKSRGFPQIPPSSPAFPRTRSFCHHRGFIAFFVLFLHPFLYWWTTSLLQDTVTFVILFGSSQPPWNNGKDMNVANDSMLSGYVLINQWVYNSTADFWSAFNIWSSVNGLPWWASNVVT